MFKRIGFSLLIAAIRPAVALAAKFIPLNAVPSLPLTLSKSNVVAKSDATASAHPTTLVKATIATEPELPLLDVNFCGECLPFDRADVVDRWKHVFTLFRPQASDLGSLRERAESFSRLSTLFWKSTTYPMIFATCRWPKVA
ncbi:hypothetical protein [Spirosoma sp. KNUC1025]|uniref:hypothetical protein n=1 Tax=Spirosoma sp. KNUC1025 TaxID=2894082 RepID=UPI00386C702A|nr:hypothetical protein LN737_17780 [Spirosoma sp. KNUC1025]